MKKSLKIPEQRSGDFYHPSITLTTKQDLSSLRKALTEKELNHFMTLYELSEQSPKKALPKVLEFSKDFPDVPEVLNLLTFLYIARRKIGKADHLIEKNFQKNPYYFIARLNYADLCLRRKEYQKFIELFNHKTNLPDLFPNKKMFHLSEFRSFMVLMSEYFFEMGSSSLSECYIYLATRIFPDHPSVNRLKKKFYYVPFRKRLILKIKERCKLNKIKL